MDHPPNPFDLDPLPAEARIASVLAKLATVLRSHDWAGASQAGLTPTQGRALALLEGETDGLRLGSIAEALAVSAPTASDAMAALARKGLVERSQEGGDRRAARFRLSKAGAVAAAGAKGWPGFLEAALATLPRAEQAGLNRALIAIVRALQLQGDIPVQRMCVTCRFFQPFAHADDVERPHHCAYVDAAFGDRRLRLDCREQEPAPPAAQAVLWQRFNPPASGGVTI
jgi:DNA-binding MarR family transcriptional regulator